MVPWNKTIWCVELPRKQLGEHVDSAEEPTVANGRKQLSVR